MHMAAEVIQKFFREWKDRQIEKKRKAKEKNKIVFSPQSRKPEFDTEGESQ